MKKVKYSEDHLKASFDFALGYLVGKHTLPMTKNLRKRKFKDFKSWLHNCKDF